MSSNQWKIEVHRKQSALPNPLIVILGPTAVGKSEIAIQLAERLDGEIVSADSRLFYRGMDIGTAKPTEVERSRVPHHLIDVAGVDEVWSLAVFQEAAQKTIAEIQAREHLPFLVGGTGQYVRAVTEAWDLPKQEPDPRFRAVLESWGRALGEEEIHHCLSIVDPQAAAVIEPRNLRRTVRALEVIFRTGKRFSDQRRRGISPYKLLLLGLTRPRVELYVRIDARIQAMLDAGFVEEVRDLLGRGYTLDLPGMSAIGYRQIAAYIQGQITLDEVVAQIKRITRQFVRRQANWFKLDDPNIHWFQVGAGTVEEMEEVIREFLRK
ncbi:MAG: tRNA (adenosine(37)-N6)-dimethylallyltransferase MiaA [Anaerolineales bacterium]|nr:tRNA (adenosine(37)-N6)-dimethylallyltransferase MiaA [Anaerolineales bacterium]